MSGHGRTYLVGASGEAEGSSDGVEWGIQIERNRSFVDRLFGRNVVEPDDPLVVLLEKVIRVDARSASVEVDRNV